MKVDGLMTRQVVTVGPEESVAVAARTLAGSNVGALPVCGKDGKLCGVVTDRDLVVRCLACQLPPETTPVRRVMTGRVLSVTPDTPAEAAAKLMGREQIRRLPVTQNGRLCGMVSLADLTSLGENSACAAAALQQISAGIRSETGPLFPQEKK